MTDLHSIVSFDELEQDLQAETGFETIEDPTVLAHVRKEQARLLTLLRTVKKNAKNADEIELEPEDEQAMAKIFQIKEQCIQRLRDNTTGYGTVLQQESAITEEQPLTQEQQGQINDNLKDLYERGDQVFAYVQTAAITKEKKEEQGEKQKSARDIARLQAFLKEEGKKAA